jgi:NitT/TauT family transport system substrate-binding protein
VPLRLNQGDPSEARVYYCPHFVAAGLSLFQNAGVDVEFVRTRSGGDRVKGGQVPALLRREADLTIGGPMVTMRMLQDGEGQLLNFCGVVSANPWYLVARHPVPGFTWGMLRGRTIVDVANITTASLCFRWLLRREGIADGAATIIAGLGDEAQDFATLRTGAADFAIHSLHALGPWVADGRLSVVSDLAGPTGPIPWSAYIARPDTIGDRRSELTDFVRAIAAALSWMHAHTSDEIASVIERYYPGYPRSALIEVVDRYRAVAVWPKNPLIPQADFDRFAGILTDVGWLDRPVAYRDQVDPSLAEAALASMGANQQ